MSEDPVRVKIETQLWQLGTGRRAIKVKINLFCFKIKSKSVGEWMRGIVIEEGIFTISPLLPT